MGNDGAPPCRTTSALGCPNTGWMPGTGEHAEKSGKGGEGPEAKAHKEQLKEPGVFSLKERKLRGDPTAAFHSLKVCPRADRVDLFSAVPEGRTRGSLRREIQPQAEEKCPVLDSCGAVTQPASRRSPGGSIAGGSQTDWAAISLGWIEDPCPARGLD